MIDINVHEFTYIYKKSREMVVAFFLFYGSPRISVQTFGIRYIKLTAEISLSPE